MKTSTNILLSSVMTLLLAVPAASFAQRSTTRPGTSQSARPAARPNTQTRPAATPARPSTSVPAKPAATPPVRPSGNSTAKPATPSKPATPAKPATPSASPSTPSRPSSPSASPSTPSRPSKPSTSPSAPSKPSSPSTPPASTTRPNTNTRPSTPDAGRRPSTPAPGTSNRPANNRPNNPGPSAGTRPPAAPAPPAYRPNVNRPNHNYIQPSYRPPRPSGGYWGAPPPSIYRPTWIRPVPPPRPPVINYRIPTLGNILGLAFGSFIDAGINTLYRAGYNVLGYANNIVYLGNVNQLGYAWPEATIYYTDGLMSNAQFQYWTTYYSSSRFDSLYATLTNLYGYPAERTVTNGVTAVSWWAGGDTGYITLSYGPGIGSTGLSYYYTTLTYSDYF